jgi:uncharacterized protein YihD (DUF1040 family)
MLGNDLFLLQYYQLIIKYSSYQSKLHSLSYDIVAFQLLLVL